ncbi:MAG: hypothetical protein EBZ48_08465 [Proteobacteria bacterium]|nr:hypothetical protein [Pseudomonadota bacterium]
MDGETKRQGRLERRFVGALRGGQEPIFEMSSRNAKQKRQQESPIWGEVQHTSSTCSRYSRALVPQTLPQHESMPLQHKSQITAA